MKIINCFKAVALSAMLFLSLSAYAATAVEGDETVFNVTLVEEKPTVILDGKECKFTDFMSQMMNLKTPEGCQPGSLTCKMVISSDGTVKDVKVMRGIDEPTDAAAVKIISTTGKWTPAKYKGKAVASQLMLKVVFR